jgi:hypothetical protein
MKFLVSAKYEQLIIFELEHPVDEEAPEVSWCPFHRFAESTKKFNFVQ